MRSKFRKKPVVVDAITVRSALDTRKLRALPEWARVAYEDGAIVVDEDHLTIKTLEGDMRAEREDWLIRGVKGEIYPCKPDIFEATYEPADDL